MTRIVSSLFLLGALMSGTLHAADEPKFVPVPLEQAAGSKALADYPANEGWRAVPQGRQVFEQVPFDVLHKVQLAGNTDSKDGRLYVARSLGIAVGQRLGRLHLLYAANIPGIPGQPLAALRLHYSNGATQTLFVTYGVHVKNYYGDGEPDEVTDADSKLVWRGPRPNKPRSFYRLYKTTFTLRTDSALETIDAFSLFSKSSLGIFAMTGELADGGATQTAPTASSDESQYHNSLTLHIQDPSGNAVPGSHVRGIVFDTPTRTVTLGRMDDSASEPGIVPVDFPASARELRLVVEAKNYVPMETVLKAGPGGGFVRDMTVKLEPGVRIGGVVRDPDGSAVAKAKVGIYRASTGAAGEPELRYAESTTDKRGRWSAHEVPENMEHLRFRITHSDFRATEVALSGGGKGAPTREALLAGDAELRFENAPTISGTVRDAAGQPLASIEVTLSRTNPPKNFITEQVRTDAQGHFVFPSIESSRARLYVNDPRFAPTAYLVNLDQPPGPVDITLTTGKPLKLRAVEAPTRLNPEIGPALAGAIFSVVDAGGVMFWKANADFRGEAIWDKPLQHSSEAGLTNQGKIPVHAQGVGGYRQATAWIDPNAGEALIKMEKWIPWKVRAIDAETKEPILNFTTLNSRPPTFADKFGPSRAINGEALAGYFAETFIHERVLTIEAEGYETLRFPLMPELGATNTYELKRKK
ncbi:MAG: resA 1 [Verrucomicrobiales bacterium]|nr:resA 1 [Verrucomicrobiales bacterium]